MRPRSAATGDSKPGEAFSDRELERLRADFPILHQEVHGHPLVYLDNAASTQKPRAVIEAMARFYERDYANVHRGVYALSERATAAYEGARERVRRFLNAADAREIVFVRGTTEAINLVASSFGRARIGPGDEIVVTALEHHSNLVPWQLVAAERGARLRVVPITESCELDLAGFERLLGPRTRLVAVVHLSNAVGTLNPVAEIIETAHQHGVPVLVDGAQAVARRRVDVRALGCDFYAFSGHKLYGPSGIGVLYGRAELLEELPPYQGGGEMIATVEFERSTYAPIPHKFEAGTPNIAGAVGLAAAIDYVEGVGIERIEAHERALVSYAVGRLAQAPGVRIVGAPRQRAGVVSFLVDTLHPHDIATVLDHAGVAVRAGHHCAQPLLRELGLTATVRASFALYNTAAEVDALLKGIGHVREVLGA